MHHDLGPPYEPVGSHGLSEERRKCRLCGETFYASETPPTGCTGPVAARGASSGPREAAESSCEQFEPPAPPAARGWPRGSIRVSLQRVDGLGVERIVDGRLLDKSNYPDAHVMIIFERMLREFLGECRRNPER